MIKQTLMWHVTIDEGAALIQACSAALNNAVIVGHLVSVDNWNYV